MAVDSEHNHGTSNEDIKPVNLRKTLFITEAGMAIFFNSIWMYNTLSRAEITIE